MPSLTLRIFGKAGCQKCHALLTRVEKLLLLPEYQHFSFEYHACLTVPGLVEFMEAGCLCPLNIPAIVCGYYNDDQEFVYLTEWEVPTWKTRDFPGMLYSVSGMWTDYDGPGRGVITPNSLITWLNDICHDTGVGR